MIAILLSTLAILFALGSPAFAHDIVVKACFNVGKPVKKLQDVINENGMISEVYDRNDDGKIDIEVMSPIKQVTRGMHGELQYEHDNGLLYAVDQDFDGAPDYVFIDQSGTGKCSELRLYQNLGHNGGNPQSDRTGGT